MRLAGGWVQGFTLLDLVGRASPDKRAAEPFFSVRGLTARPATTAFSAADLKSAGYDASELKVVGFKLAQLKEAEFAPGELKAAGFAPRALKGVGFTQDELRAGGFTDAELDDDATAGKQVKTASRVAASKSKWLSPSKRRPGDAV